MNSENNKTSKPYILLLNLSDKINLKNSDTNVALSNLLNIIRGKMLKSHITTVNLKYDVERETWNEKSELPDRIIFYIRNGN